MIRSFRDKETQRLFERRRSRRFPAIERIADRNLIMLDVAVALSDLQNPPGNHLGLVTGDRSGRYSIRINDQWRICFEWRDGMPTRSKSSITTKGGRKIRRIHPGEILREEFLVPLEMSAKALALHVPATRITEITHERRGISADTALRLARYFNMTPEFWMNLQTRYDLDVAKDASAEAIAQEIHPRKHLKVDTKPPVLA